MIVTLSNVAVAFTPVTWLDTASPTYTTGAMVNVDDPTCVHVVPSADSYPVIVLPARVSFTHRGAVDWLPGELTLMAPSARRR